MAHSSIANAQKFIAHWKSVRKDSLVPRLSDFLENPAPDLQPNVLLVDIIGEDRLNVRLIGTGLVELIGRELTKTNALDLYAEPLRHRTMQACRQMISRPCGQISERMATTARGLIVPTTSVALPLRTRTGIDCLAGFSIASDAVDVGDSVYSIFKVASAEWIDIGSGVPAPSQ